MEGLIFGILQYKLPKLCSATINSDFLNHQGKTNNHCFKNGRSKTPFGLQNSIHYNSSTVSQIQIDKAGKN